MSGIKDFKEKTIEKILREHGFTDRYDDRLDQVLEENDVTLNPDNLTGFEEDRNKYHYWLITAVRQILDSVIPPELVEVFYPTGKPSNIRVSVELDFGIYKDDYRLLVSIQDKHSIVKSLDPVWVFEHHRVLEDFMRDSETYNKLIELRTKINNKFSKL